MHNMRKTIGKLHDLLIKYEKGLPKKAATPQVMAIQGGRIQKANTTKRWVIGRGGSLEEVGHWKRNCPVKDDTKEHPAKERLMMNLINLPLSFWNYALESAIRILNMVSTKKVDKTLYKSSVDSEIPMEVEGFEPPQEEVVPIPTMLDPESNKWLDAMNAKMQSMKDNQVWCLVDLPPNAKGFTQTYGVDYEETFSPVADIRAIRILIAIAAFYDYEIWQMDVKTAFLNGYLDEDIYMVQPEGFVDPKHPRKVCKLQRSIYGLKQASRSWNKRFDEEIKKFGFAQNLDEPCVYQKASGSNVTFLILYVDDIIIMGNHIPSLQSVKSYLGKCFAMKDLGEATFILGIKIYRDRLKRLIGLSQSASTPEEVKQMQNVPYASAVESIINTKDMLLAYGGNPEPKLRLDCYCDVGFETDRDDIKS
ncbi:retrotransposon protein, putative, ty1-copia subclass [Tanacetum coccineum]